MLAALVERDRRLASVQSPAVMEYTAGDQHLKAKEEIVAKRPGNLRVEAMSPFGVALLLAAQGSGPHNLRAGSESLHARNG